MITAFDPEDIHSPVFLVPSSASNKRMQPAEIVGIVYRKVLYHHVTELCYKARVGVRQYIFCPVNDEEFKVIDQYKASYYCRDCSDNTLDEPYTDQYMVNDGLWRKFGSGKGMLCITCFQNRILQSSTPRALEVTDFTDHALNTSNRFIKQLKASNHAKSQ